MSVSGAPTKERGKRKMLICARAGCSQKFPARFVWTDEMHLVVARLWKYKVEAKNAMKGKKDVVWLEFISNLCRKGIHIDIVRLQSCCQKLYLKFK